MVAILELANIYGDDLYMSRVNSQSFGKLSSNDVALLGTFTLSRKPYVIIQMRTTNVCMIDVSESIP